MGAGHDVVRDGDEYAYNHSTSGSCRSAAPPRAGGVRGGGVRCGGGRCDGAASGGALPLETALYSHDYMLPRWMSKKPDAKRTPQPSGIASQLRHRLSDCEAM